jgi:hypothetical protein
VGVGLEGCCHVLFQDAIPEFAWQNYSANFYCNIVTTPMDVRRDLAKKILSLTLRTGLF